MGKVISFALNIALNALVLSITPILLLAWFARVRTIEYVRKRQRARADRLRGLRECPRWPMRNVVRQSRKREHFIRTAKMMRTSSLATFLITRRFRSGLRISGWVAFCTACLSSIVLSYNVSDLSLGLLVAGAGILAGTHLLAWLTKWVWRARRRRLRAHLSGRHIRSA
jgi:hypothetical protein